MSTTQPLPQRFCVQAESSRLLKKAICGVGALRAALRRTRRYASRLASRAALHLDLFEQPERKRVLQQPARRLAEGRRRFRLTGLSCLASFIYRDGSAENQAGWHGPSGEQQEVRAWVTISSHDQSFGASRRRAGSGGLRRLRILDRDADMARPADLDGDGAGVRGGGNSLHSALDLHAGLGVESRGVRRAGRRVKEILSSEDAEFGEFTIAEASADERAALAQGGYSLADWTPDPVSACAAVSRGRMRGSGRVPGTAGQEGIGASGAYQTAGHRVVILGGGFGGLHAARELARTPVRATLLDRRNFHLFQPLLYQVATGDFLPPTSLPPSGTSSATAEREGSPWRGGRSRTADAASPPDGRGDSL